MHRDRTRVAGYIDGFNLYFGLRERGFNQFYWIDPYKLVDRLLSQGHDLKTVKYFTARVRNPKEKRDRQTAFLDAVSKVSETEVILGKFYKKNVRCRACGSSWLTFEEKMTDSAIAAHLVADAFLDRFETAILIGGDTDIVPAIKMVKRHFPQKQLIAWFPPSRKNQAVADICHDSASITGEHLKHCLMPDRIEVADGVFMERPASWR